MGSEISHLSSFSICTGILLGPVDLETEKEPITLATSSGVVGFKNIELGLGFLRNLEKWLRDGGIFERMESAVVVKKSLKKLELQFQGLMWLYLQQIAK